MALRLIEDALQTVDGTDLIDAAEKARIRAALLALEGKVCEREALCAIRPYACKCELLVSDVLSS